MTLVISLTRPTTHCVNTSLALVQVASYCLKQLGFKYVLLEKFHTDYIEDRFGKYRRLRGAQYHMSIWLVYEAEHKLRLQKILELPENDEVCHADEFHDALQVLWATHQLNFF